ncbi:MAG: peptide ABC transporter substrate-binding protein [Thermomicrobiales bacterium]
MWCSGKPRRRGSLGRLTALLFLVPMVLAACGGATTATDTPKPQATTAPTAAASNGAATTAATKPASTAAATTASGTAAPASTTAASSATSGTAASQASGAGFGTPLTTKRGEGGPLRLLWWQAPVILNVHLSNGTKDTDASSLVTEPLARISSKSIIPDIPVLAKEIPSVQNGEISADYTTVTWKLKDGVTWSDGQPFTADDVVFTWQFIMKPENGSTSTSLYSDIDKVEAVDPTTAKITFKAPAAAWFVPYVGDGGEILPKHVVGTCPDSKNCDFNQKPVGTGAYVVTDFKAGDTVTYKANEKFREPNAPYFATVELKGGGDATTAAKAVQTGQADFAWNLTVTPEVIKQLTDAGKTVATPSGFYVEQLELNMADPRNEVDGELSNAKSKNPYFSDPLVRQAFSYVVDRDSIAKNLWGPGGVAGNTLIPVVRGDKGAPYSYGLKKAADLLDQAGWKKGSDGIREKDGVKMNMTFRSSIVPQRDKEAQVIKESLKQLGINLDIRSVDASVYFGKPDNPDSAIRFTTDINMLATGSSKPDPQSFFEGFTTAQMPSKANNWGGSNINRWSDAKYDQMYDQFKRELDAEKRKTISEQLDSYIIAAGIRVPMIIRNDVYATRPDLINVEYSPFSSEAWNVGHWTLKK